MNSKNEAVGMELDMRRCEGETMDRARQWTSGQVDVVIFLTVHVYQVMVYGAPTVIVGDLGLDRMTGQSESRSGGQWSSVQCSRPNHPTTTPALPLE